MASRLIAYVIAWLGVLVSTGVLADPCVAESCAEGLSREEITDDIKGVHLLQTHSAGKSRNKLAFNGIPPFRCWSHEELFDFDQEGAMYLLHIPKTAACSLKADLDSALGFGKIFSREGCYSMRKEHNFKSAITMLRNPRDHVLSQFVMCDTGGDLHLRLPLSLTRFGVWIRAWAEMQETGPLQDLDVFFNDRYNCYRPISLMTQRFTCNGTYTYPKHYDIAEAVDNMMQTEFVGITEVYQESICLFMVKLAGSLPSFCDCSDPVAWNSYKPTEMEHESKPHHIEDYSEGVLADLDRLTVADRVLYRAGVERFRREIREVEKRFGTKIMCNDIAQIPALQYVLAPLAD